jgi:SAM-dependent methyltransferase
MSWLDLPRTDEPEEIDDPTQSYSDIVRSMNDLARANRVFWGTWTILSHVARLLKNVPSGTPIRILDIATGSADIPRALTAWGQRRGLALSVVGVDSMPAMLRMAREADPAMLLVQADALCLPFAPRSFDIALCALAFHHFGFAASVRILQSMDTLTTRGFVVSDLRRDRLSLVTVQIGLALIRAHSFTRHDGSASVRRAFTPREYAKMVALSGVQNVRLHSQGYVRLALVQDKGEKSEEWV